MLLVDERSEPRVYVASFGICGVKCFGSDQEFQFPQRQDERYAGWHVILGANATGKTTLLQAIAMSLLGPSLKLMAPVGWVRRDGTKYGSFRARITKGAGDKAETNLRGPFSTAMWVTPNDSVSIQGQDYDHVDFVLALADPEKKRLLGSIYALKKSGWFSCGYGPFRRLSGGDNAILSTLFHARQHRFASLFFEAVALAQSESWLIKLHHEALDDRDESAARKFDVVKSIINSLLPGGVEIQQVTPKEVRFATSGGQVVSLSELSDGYRSFLALAIDILRHVTEVFGEEIGNLTKDIGEGDEKHIPGSAKVEKRVLVEGVVLIDEVDAHLHPSWQRTIGLMLQKVFPNIQFIVSSHSPFIAQAASEGGLFVLRSTPSDNTVHVIQPIKSVRGWRAESILTSELFGMTETVDPETESMLREYHQLSTKRSFGQLSGEEETRLEHLEHRVANELTAPGETSEEFRRRREMDDYVDRTLQGMSSSAGESDS